MGTHLAVEEVDSPVLEPRLWWILRVCFWWVWDITDPRRAAETSALRMPDFYVSQSVGNPLFCGTSCIPPTSNLKAGYGHCPPDHCPGTAHHASVLTAYGFWCHGRLPPTACLGLLGHYFGKVWLNRNSIGTILWQFGLGNCCRRLSPANAPFENQHKKASIPSPARVGSYRFSTLSFCIRRLLWVQNVLWQRFRGFTIGAPGFAPVMMSLHPILGTTRVENNNRRRLAPQVVLRDGKCHRHPQHLLLFLGPVMPTDDCKHETWAFHYLHGFCSRLNISKQTLPLVNNFIESIN